MLISWNWLQDFVDLSGIDPEDAAARLTMAGLEVAGVTSTCDTGLEKLRTVRIEDIKPHPEADKLSLCLINDGRQEHSIVCGASNMQAGDLVALAPVGTTLPGGLTIKKAKIRGIASNGMLCSAAELGLEEESAGIMILPPDAPLGCPVIDLLNLRDIVLEVEITPNRGDCLSVMGVARELAAIYERPYKLPAIKLSETETPATERVRIEISDPQLCPRYVGRVVEDVVDGESPFWLKARLKAAGVRSLGSIVDVTNYIMLETGQPLHAFDLDLLNNAQIIVRRAGEDRRFTTLDSIERELDPETLMICDGSGPVAIAGVMGGENSEINPETKNVLIESAFFDPASVRASARRLSLGTEASYRFERGVDSAATAWVADRAAELLQQLAGGRVCRGRLDVHPQPRALPLIELRFAVANRLLGIDLSAAEIENLLRRLQIEIIAKDESSLRVQPPAWRFDLEREIDLIEEVARLYGYDRVPTAAPKMCGPEVLDRPEAVQLDQIRRYLVAAGINEAVNYSFIDPAALDRLGLVGDFQNFVRLRNPISSEMAVMRTSLLPGLLQNLSDNLRVNVKDVALAEIGRVFYAQAGEKLPREELKLAVVLCGRRQAEHFSNPDQEVDFFDIKGVLEDLADTFKVELGFDQSGFYPCLAPGRSASVSVQNQPLGSLGLLHDQVATAWDLESDIYLLEISLDALLGAAQAGPGYQGLARYPAVYRDLAFLIDAVQPAGEMLDFMRSQHKLLTAVEIFDVFCNQSLPAGKKSVAFRLTFQDQNKTLTDKKVNAIIERLVKALDKQFSAVIR